MIPTAGNERSESGIKENETGRILVDADVKVQTAPGPGSLKPVSEAALAKELERKGLSAARQIEFPVECEGMEFDEGFRADIIDEGKVILELKSVEQTSKVHHKQLFTYLM